jgi:uncharacterized protein (DUF2147 family)
MSKHAFALVTFIVWSLAVVAKPGAVKTPIEKVWYDEKKTCKIEIYTGQDGKYYGKMIWLNEPIDKKTGKIQMDKENPDSKHREDPLMGLVILQGFTQDKDDKNLYTGGTVYDPDSGKTFCGKITFKGDKLDLRGYLCSFSLFGRTETWTLVDSQ